MSLYICAELRTGKRQSTDGNEIQILCSVINGNGVFFPLINLLAILSTSSNVNTWEKNYRQLQHSHFSISQLCTKQFKIADSISVYKCQLNKCKNSLKNSLSIKKDRDDNVLGKWKSDDDSCYVASNSTFQMCLSMLRWN